jgi:hypothetical protein
MALNGADVKLYVKVSGTYRLVGEQTNMALDDKVGEIDTSTKDDSNQSVIGGRRSATLTLDALVAVPDTNAVQAELDTAKTNRTLVLAQIWVTGAAVKQASFLVTGISRKYPDQANSTLSVSMTRSGGWTAIG